MATATASQSIKAKFTVNGETVTRVVRNIAKNAFETTGFVMYQNEERLVRRLKGSRKWELLA